MIFGNFKFNKVGRELSDNKYYFSEKKIGDDYYYLGMLALKMIIVMIMLEI